jgi:hypothetical protein
VSDPKRLFEEALHLLAEKRAALAAALIEGLDLEVDEDVEAAWSAEISRRLEKVAAGVAKTIPWSEARRRILAAAGRASNASVSRRSDRTLGSSIALRTSMAIAGPHSKLCSEVGRS